VEISPYKLSDICWFLNRSIGLYAIHDACSEYNTSQTVNERSQFQSRIQEIMVERLGAIHAVVTDLQMSNIERPSKYEQALQAKESAKESITTAQLERPRKLVEVDTKLKKANTQAEITIALAKSKAKIAITKATAQAEAIMEAYRAEATIYSSIMKQQNLTIEGLLSYLSVRVVGETDNTVYAGLEAPAKTKYTH
jgi:prohibitin 2